MSDAPGWAAINHALYPIYGDTEPTHWAAIPHYRFGGSNPLDGISVYPRVDPVPHWHYVSYGMSDLYEKETDIPDVSGWGFEFTFRLARNPADTQPPTWPADMLGGLGQYVIHTGNWFEPDQHMNLNGPMNTEGSTLTAALFTLDPELGEIATPNGQMQFLQIVGITEDEYNAIQEWDSRSFLNTISNHLPLFVTDPLRQSLLTQPAIAMTVRDGIAREGSSTGTLLVERNNFVVRDELTVLTFGTNPAPRIATLLRARIPFDKELHVVGPNGTVSFLPGNTLTLVHKDDRTVEITLAGNTLSQLIKILSQRQVGYYPIAPNLALEINESVAQQP